MNNKRVQLSDNFYLDEYLPKEFYQNLEKNVNVSQYIRKTTGLSCSINNWWHVGGTRTDSGHRLPNSKWGSALSQHRMMNAQDIRISNWSGQVMYEFVVKHAKELYALGVRRVEAPSLTPTWLHLDFKEHGKKNTIQVVDLTKVVSEIKF